VRRRKRRKRRKRAKDLVLGCRTDDGSHGSEAGVRDE
jgi:hypothetical protein